jgi:hypothetical protein
MTEETLPGGNTDGAVRIGGVVHKRASPSTPTVHALLRHLEQAGVDGVPRALGFDEQGRQIVLGTSAGAAHRPGSQPAVRLARRRHPWHG